MAYTKKPLKWSAVGVEPSEEKKIQGFGNGEYPAAGHFDFKFKADYEAITELQEKSAEKTDLENKVEKVTGKGLSTNDYTTAEKDKLAGIATGANNYSHPPSHPPSIITQDSNNRFVSDAEKTKWNGKLDANANAVSASKFLQVDTRATNENPQYYMAIGNGVVYEFKGNSVIGLSSSFSEVPAYSEVSTYISWKDQSGGYPLQLAVNNAGMYYRNGASLTTWGQWNKISTTAVATTTSNGVMSSTDKAKLDGIANGANNYTHPSTHPATMITDDATHRFVTDTEKSNWNSKETTTGAQAKIDALAGTGNTKTVKQIDEAFTTHQADDVKHITATERKTWNNANSKANDLEILYWMGAI